MPQMFSPRHFIVLLCVCLCYTISAQNVWEPGHVVLNSGDTLHGLLKSKADIKNSHYIRFRQSKNASITSYTPEQARSYFLSTSDKWYISALVTTDTTKGVLFFLQVIVDGSRADYYYLRDRMEGAKYFMNVRDKGIKELRQIKTVVHYNNNGELQTRTQIEKPYLDSLQVNFADCKAIVTDSKFKTTEFQFRPLAKKVFTYNRCVASGQPMYVANRLKNSAAIELIISGGIGYSTVRVDGYKYNLLNPQGVTTYSIGIAGNFFLPFTNKAFSIQPGIDFTKKGASSTASKTTFDLPYVDLSLMVKYNYPHGVVRPYAGLGLLWGYSTLGSKSYYKDDKGVRTYLSERQDGPMDDYTEFGFLCEAGIKFAIKSHRIFVSGNYQRTLIPFNFTSTNYINSYIQARIGYAFLIQTKSKFAK